MVIKPCNTHTIISGKRELNKSPPINILTKTTAWRASQKFLAYTVGIRDDNKITLVDSLRARIEVCTNNDMNMTLVSSEINT